MSNKLAIMERNPLFTELTPSESEAIQGGKLVSPSQSDSLIPAINVSPTINVSPSINVSPTIDITTVIINGEANGQKNGGTNNGINGGVVIVKR
jgi:hypothetical protein